MKAFLFFGLLLSSVLVLPAAHALEVGEMAPCVELNDIQPNGSESEECIRTRYGATKFTLIEFFSVTCSACEANLPVLSQLATEVSASTTSRLVSIDRNEASVREYIKGHKGQIQIPVALDSARDAKNAYGVIATPETFILDSKNKVIYKHIGTYEEAELTQIKALLK